MTRGLYFLNDLFAALVEYYDVKHRKTTPYNPRANGLTERANGIVCKVFNNVDLAHKDWDKKLYSAFHSYNITVKTTTDRSPYLLVYGQDTIHPTETEIETLRVPLALEAETKEDGKQRL